MSTTVDRPRGFSLVETIVALLLATLLIGVVMSMFLTQRRTIWRQKQLNDMHQNLRMGMDMVTCDVRMAGYGVP
ncbi:MAG: prepilin-type N-terminal cleavage/methylation domain-containing protein, partial [Lentisphaerae bacterium]|nr:prepilin-type N-terminal cleavage/methylation domain-containing protein [Lentisphaerota bacterium]